MNLYNYVCRSRLRDERWVPVFQVDPAQVAKRYEMWAPQVDDGGKEQELKVLANALCLTGVVKFQCGR